MGAITHGLFHGEVEGGSLYDVLVRIDDASMRCMVSCSCPFAAKGKRCKHSAAVMLAIGGSADNDDASLAPPQGGADVALGTWLDEPCSIRVDVYDEIRSRLASWYGAHGPLLVWDEAVVGECAGMAAVTTCMGGPRFPVLSGSQAGRMTESFIQSFLESDGARRDVGDAFEGADVVLDNALAAEDYGQALSNVFLVMRIVGSSLEYVGGDGGAFEEGGLERSLEHLAWKVRLLVERTVADERSGVGTFATMAAGIMGFLREEPEILGEKLGVALLSFSRRQRTRRIADEALDGWEHAMNDAAVSRRSSRLHSYMCRLRHDDLLLAGEYARAAEFESDHMDDEAMAWLAATRFLLEDSLDRAWEVAARYPATSRGSQVDSCPIDSSPCGWTELSVALARRLGNWDALERLRHAALKGAMA
ncbi:SWIM zinc finger family protein [Bifidobacterium saguinibicoloris]|uniref:SWIM zinc finger family protein n=1 Tax=Bifidobacterium saguinibicoloris TaxID=2834433 RepID=UPI001C59AC70|nr:SWIM zinc finger family protein [Bifidobacterium saguinibicoloris]